MINSITLRLAVYLTHHLFCIICVFTWNHLLNHKLKQLLNSIYALICLKGKNVIFVCHIVGESLCMNWGSLTSVSPTIISTQEKETQNFYSGLTRIDSWAKSRLSLVHCQGDQRNTDVSDEQLVIPEKKKICNYNFRTRWVIYKKDLFE